MAKPLEGVRVLDLSHVIAGPLASFYLAQLGAEVIKVEPPLAGEVLRSMKNGVDTDTPTGFAAINAGKQSLALDIRTRQGADLLRSLAASADVFIENFRPGVVARYGLDYASIKAVKPDIVYCSISGFGQQGAWSQRGAYDHVVQAMTGMMMMSGEGDDAPPLKVGFPVIDVAVGMLGALSIVSALHRRLREGAGQYIDASMVQASLALMYTNTCAYLSDGTPTRRVGNRGYTGSPAADTYRCADGWLAVAANTPEQFRKLTAAIGVEALCGDAKALDLEAFNLPNGFVVPNDREYVVQQLRAAFSTRSAAQLEDLLSQAGVPAAKVRKLEEFLDEADVTGCVSLPDHRFHQGGRELRTHGLGFAFEQDGGPTKAGAPALGEGTREVLRRVGLDDAAIAELERAGVLRTQADTALPLIP
ncbi:CaiB/BaiF CoA transferase family protein [Achromobacter xylosoxidans]|uniref:CoA transferase n=1 Tax=Alcaligenes xylosoxydans xylosoxydans TaxID=85698 RepID=A0A424W7X1_ALCXX|nr:CoA transferase [Achromobacter xylosoxidans]MBC9908483.1 CoA transferase [Achromobacter xylosoxidans]MBD0870715.1 CoA transferase [Achromobacter xylosoxidans]QNP83813.1 CoA transferase [Achromobacter xylosoxidans]RPJ89307.1 CoA transferase [Achromobacter xylosoxidans]